MSASAVCRLVLRSCLLLFALWLCLLAPALAQDRPAPAKAPAPADAAKPAEAPKPASKGTGPGEFTITRIDPDPDAGVIHISFSVPVPLSAVEGRVAVFPATRLNWGPATRMDGKGRLTLAGDFRPGPATVAVPESLVAGGRRYVPTLVGFTMPPPTARLTFVDGRDVVERRGPRLAHLRVRTSPRTTLGLLRLPPLLAPYLEADAGRHDLAFVAGKAAEFAAKLSGVEEAKPYARFLEPAAPVTEVFNTATKARRELAFSLPLAKGLPPGGSAILAVEAVGGGKGAKPARRVLSVTDLGLTTFFGAHDVLVRASSLADASPVAGARVFGFTYEGFVADLGATDERGVFWFQGGEKKGFAATEKAKTGGPVRKIEPSALSHLVAVSGEDVAMARLSPLGSMRAPGGLGQARPRQGGVEDVAGGMFTERGLYRAGDTVHIRAVLRGFEQGAVKAAANERVTLTVRDPSGNEAFSKELKTGEFGGISADFVLPDTAALGEYSITAQLARERVFRQGYGDLDRLDQRYERPDKPDTFEKRPSDAQVHASFQVHDFKPPRHFVEANVTPETDAQGRKVAAVSIRGAYYAGGVLKNAQLRYKISTEPAAYEVPAYPEHQFGEPPSRTPALVESGQAVLGDDGSARLTVPLDAEVQAGRMALKVSAVVLDFDGRSAQAVTSFQQRPEILFGFKSLDESGDFARLDVVALDRGDKPAGRLTAKMERFSLQYVSRLKRTAKGEAYTDSVEVWKPLDARSVEFKDGHALLDVARAGYDDVKVRFTTPEKGEPKGAGSVVLARFFERDGAEPGAKAYVRLDLSPAKPAYAPGQTARIAVRDPDASAEYLVVVERERVLDVFVAKPKGELREIEVPVKEAYGPSVYVSVLGMSGRKGQPATGEFDSLAPRVGWGVAQLAVELNPARLAVEIAPGVDQILPRPGEKVRIDLVTKDASGKGAPAEVTVAVVMESILAMTGFATPTLSETTRFNIPLSVFTDDSRAHLLHQTPYLTAALAELTGGGGLGAAAADMMSRLRRKFSPVAYYNPALRTDAEGKASISFEAPDSLTAYRVYAVAVDKGSGLGNAERRLVVGLPFSLEPGLPEFATAGDAFAFDVAAITKKAQGKADFGVETGPGLTATPRETSVTLGPDEQKLVTVDAVAQTPGQSFVRVKGALGPDTDAAEIPLRINPAVPFGQTGFFATLSGEARWPLLLPEDFLRLSDADKARSKAVVTISGSAASKLAVSLAALVNYPYGCVEQTASKLMGLASLKKMGLAGLPDVQAKDVQEAMAKGVDRLASMQLSEGAFPYWSGSRRESAWGTVYAGLALARAKQAGAKVPGDTLDNLAQALLRMGKSANGADFQAYCGLTLAQMGYLDDKAAKELNLAATGRPREARLAGLAARLSAKLTAPQAGGAELAALLAAKPDDAPSDSFYAPYRVQAVSLLAARLADPKGQVAERLAAELSASQRANGMWTSTADTGFAVWALSDHFAGRPGPTADDEVVLGLPDGSSQKLALPKNGSARVVIDGKSLMQKPLILAAFGKPGAWQASLSLSYPRPELAAKGLSKGLGVTRQILPAGQGPIRVGDVVKVRLTVDNRSPSLSHLAIEDAIPAGFVGLNPALSSAEVDIQKRGEDDGAPQPDEEDADADAADAFADDGFIADGLYRPRPDHFEMRFDRALFFQDAPLPGVAVYEYYARAILAGEFTAGSPRALAMYRPDIEAYGLAEKIRIEPRQ